MLTLLPVRQKLHKTLVVGEMRMAVVAATLVGTSKGLGRAWVMLEVEEDGDPFLDEEVGDQLDEQRGQDQLQVLLQPAQLGLLLQLNPD